MRLVMGLSFTVMLIAAVVGCSPSVSTTETQQALCGDGSRAGCDACYPDPSSPTGGSKTCWNCNGDSHTEYCIPPPPCGSNGAACCTSRAPCNDGLDCFNGQCFPCGEYQEPCCPSTAPSCYAPYNCDTSIGATGICI
jgi:hypothetical protein